MYNGVINIYKEAGFTSNDVVCKLRGILRQKKIGHTGTLDPEATGVLPVCLGQGTKLVELLTDKRKTYRAVMLLGVTTDTQDTTGTTLSEGDWSALSENDVKEAVMSFVGPYAQIPPMYSALKVNGRKLCDLAREGIEIERKARDVNIYEIVIEEIKLPRVTMSVTCSKGTYIRTLCHDIGEKLGCGGCMEKLVRTQVDRFSIDEGLKLSDVEKLVSEGQVDTYIIPVDEMLAKYEAYKNEDPLFDKLLANGNPLPESFYKGELSEAADDSLNEDSAILSGGKYRKQIRVYDSSDTFIGLYGFDKRRYMWMPVKIFLGGK